MANYRQIHVTIWKDEWFLDLEPSEKLLFIYLFSNESTSLAGIYKIAFKVICFETGLDPEIVRSALDKFAQAGKVHYEDGVIWVVNMHKYHDSASPKVKTRIGKDIEAIPDGKLKIEYLYSMDTSLHEEEEEEEKEDKEEELNQESIAANAAPPPEQTLLILPVVSRPEEKNNGNQPALTDGQRRFLDAFGAKRFKTPGMRDAVLALERTHGTTKLREGIAWASKRGMTIGDAITALETALPNWGKNKGMTRQQREDRNDPLRQSDEARAKYAEWGKLGGRRYDDDDDDSADLAQSNTL